MDDRQAGTSAPSRAYGHSLVELVLPLVENRWWVVLGPLLIGALTLGATYLMKPTFTAACVLLPPQQSAAAAALSSLGPLASLAGGSVKAPADQYVALLQSTTVADRMIDRFGLITVYNAKFRIDARKTLERRVRISIGKKDGLISIEVDDEEPKRAADMANRFVEELRLMTSTLALTEAQQRRVLFERQLQLTRDKLIAAQQALQASGFDAGALKVEPRAAAEAYAHLRAEATATEVRLQALRSALVDSAPEVQQQLSVLAALKSQLARAEIATAKSGSGADYVSRFREFKYQETLLDMFARQYELARVDESREGTLIQVIDPATAPELKSRPKRRQMAMIAAAIALLAIAGGLLGRDAWRRTAGDPASAAARKRLALALGRQP
jgi:uncharacterized protein involved in exopolysaccharide biosynthesis